MSNKPRGAGRQLTMPLFNPAASLAGYAVGRGGADHNRNAEALAAVTQLASTAPASGSFEQILLWGGSGVGKTHLLQAVCRAAQLASHRVAYLPVAAIQPQACAGLEQVDVVCVDDVHAVIGQRQWEEALFHLYNRLRDQQRALLVSSRINLRDSNNFVLPDLQSRLTWGLAFRLQALAEADVREALRVRAKNRGFDLPDEVLDFLLNHTLRDMHSLCALVDKLDDASMEAKCRLTVPFVRDFLAGR